MVVPSPSCPLLFAPQHFTVPPAISAQAWPPPTEIIETPLPSPVTARGTLVNTGSSPTSPVASVASPIDPNWLLPQHCTPPVVVSAQADTPPAATAATPLVSPVTSAGVGLSCTFVPLPICPKRPNPQHFAPSAVVTAQADSPPALTEATPLVSVATSPGSGSPSGASGRPRLPAVPQLLPQHFRPPPTIAQLKEPPALIACTPLVSPATPAACVST